MAPNPRVAKAFNAMKDMGISADTVKPVLKELLRVYEKNWNLIEEENYRVLVDAIFDNEENKKEDHENHPQSINANNIDEDVSNSDGPRTSKKRLQLKYQDQIVPRSGNMAGNSGGSSSKRPKIADPELPGNSLVVRESLYLKDPKPETGLDVYPQKEVSNKLMLFKPKDEPCSDDVDNNILHPIDVIPPGDSLVVNGSADVMDGQQNCKSHSIKSNGSINGIQTSAADRTTHELARLSHKIPGSVEIASSSLGNIQISLKCNYVGSPGFHMPSLSSVFELVEDKCRSTYNVDSSFSVEKLMKDICNSCLELGSQSTSEPQQQDLQQDDSADQHALSRKVNGDTATSSVPNEIANPEFVTTEIRRDLRSLSDSGDLISPYEIHVTCGGKNELISGYCQDGSVLRDASPLKDRGDLAQSDQNDEINIDKENKNINGEETNDVTSEILATGELTDTSATTVKQKFDVEDVTKGQELVKISLVNEVDSTPPPSFFYIPQNLKYQNACVNVLLARIGNEDCCPDCSGDCLSSKIPCVCAQETGGEFAYTSDGLVKESILEECISMNRDPKKHCQFYCKDKECPLERTKSGDMVELCKGHLVRKFIKECWSKCGCNMQCGNRLVQRGITRNLQVFMTPKGKGWGLRTLETLPKGAFVCEYVGEILTNSELFERNMKSTLKHAYPVLLDADWGSENVLKDEEALCLDATIFGNVARFINHRCFDSNMVEIPVEVETPDRHYYHLAFFTTRDVAAMEELTWDYGIDFDDQEHPVKAFKCSCGSRFCRNIKRTRRRRIR